MFVFCVFKVCIFSIVCLVIVWLGEDIDSVNIV